jgi:hypothetical protein
MIYVIARAFLNELPPRSKYLTSAPKFPGHIPGWFSFFFLVR